MHHCQHCHTQLRIVMPLAMDPTQASCQEAQNSCGIHVIRSWQTAGETAVQSQTRHIFRYGSAFSLWHCCRRRAFTVTAPLLSPPGLLSTRFSCASTLVNSCWIDGHITGLVGVRGGGPRWLLAHSLEVSCYGFRFVC
jgi:hypothetical protein